MIRLVFTLSIASVFRKTAERKKEGTNERKREKERKKKERKKEGKGKGGIRLRKVIHDLEKNNTTGKVRNITVSKK